MHRDTVFWQVGRLLAGSNALPTINVSARAISMLCNRVEGTKICIDAVKALSLDPRTAHNRLHAWQHKSVCQYSKTERVGSVADENGSSFLKDDKKSSNSLSSSLDSWTSLLENTIEWVDERSIKSSAKDPDFCKVDRTCPLWLNRAPSELQERIRTLDPYSFANTASWGALLNNPTSWTDIRKLKKSENSPDLVEMNGPRKLWINDAPRDILERFLDWKSPNMWDSLLNDPESWIDYRYSKKAANGPDFRKANGRECLRLDDADASVRMVIEELNPERFANAKSWLNFLKTFPSWTDKRRNKDNPKSPDFVKTEKKETHNIWLCDAPTWVLERLVKDYDVDVQCAAPAGSPSTNSTVSSSRESLPGHVAPSPAMHSTPQTASETSDEASIRSDGTWSSSEDTAWLHLLNNPESYWDKRANKKKTDSPDFVCKASGDELWLDTAPPFVLEHFKMNASSGKSYGLDQALSSLEYTRKVETDSHAADVSRRSQLIRNQGATGQFVPGAVEGSYNSLPGQTSLQDANSQASQVAGSELNGMPTEDKQQEDFVPASYTSGLGNGQLDSRVEGVHAGPPSNLPSQTGPWEASQQPWQTGMAGPVQQTGYPQVQINGQQSAYAPSESLGHSPGFSPTPKYGQQPLGFPQRESHSQPLTYPAKQVYGSLSGSSSERDHQQLPFAESNVRFTQQSDSQPQSSQSHSSSVPPADPRSNSISPSAPAADLNFKSPQRTPFEVKPLQSRSAPTESYADSSRRLASWGEQQQHGGTGAWQGNGQQPQYGMQNQMGQAALGSGQPAPSQARYGQQSVSQQPSAPSPFQQQGFGATLPNISSQHSHEAAAPHPFSQQNYGPTAPGISSQQSHGAATSGPVPRQSFGGTAGGISPQQSYGAATFGPLSPPSYGGPASGVPSRPDYKGAGQYQPSQYSPGSPFSGAPQQQHSGSFQIAPTASSNWKASGGKSGNARQSQKQELWDDLMQNCTNWYDNRFDKKNPKGPDFKQKDSGIGLWLADAPKGVIMWLEQKGSF